MKLVFLVNGNDAKDLLKSIPFPDGSEHHIGRYGDRDVYVITVSIDKKTVYTAKTLADYRDRVLALGNNKKPDMRDIKCLRDEASEFFCARLYPKFIEYERGLRMAVTIALCADRDSFDSKVAASLESITLERLGERLFTDRNFVKAAKEATSTSYIRKKAFLHRIDRIQEKTMWDALFGNDMHSVKDLFDEVRSRRNDVMHFHTLSSDRYQTTVSMLGKINREINDFINNSLSNINYPKQQAEDSREALFRLAETYADMYKEWQQRLAPLQDNLAKNQEYYYQLAHFADTTKNSIKRIQEIASSVKKVPVLSYNYPHFEIPESTIQEAQAMAKVASRTRSLSSPYLKSKSSSKTPFNEVSSASDEHVSTLPDSLNASLPKHDNDGNINQSTRDTDPE